MIHSSFNQIDLSDVPKKDPASDAPSTSDASLDFHVRLTQEFCPPFCTQRLIAYVLDPLLPSALYICHPSTSSKLNGGKTPSIIHMLQFQLLILLTLGMEINPTDIPTDLIKTDVIEPFKARAQNLPHAMVGYQEGFFPAHEDVFPLREILVMEIGFFGLFS